MSAPVTVRPATADDVPELVAMIRELAEYERALHEVEATEEHLQRTLFGETPAVFAHIAEAGDEVVGMAIWFLNYSTWLGAHNLYLEDLYVRPGHRGSGAGRLLLQTLAGRVPGARLPAPGVVGARLEPGPRLLRDARRRGAHRVDPVPGLGGRPRPARRAALSRDHRCLLSWTPRARKSRSSPR